MNRITITPLKRLLILILVLLLVSQAKSKAQKTEVAPYTQELVNRFIAKDSSLFNAVFNTCDTKEIEAILARDFVYYQDKGYYEHTAIQSLDQFIANIKKNFCDKATAKPKMRRELVKESIEVFTENKTTATQTGTQRFYVVADGQPDRLVEESKFSRVWQLQNGDWKMKKEVDYLVTTPAAKPAVRQLPHYVPEAYTPDDEALYNEILIMDSLYFDTYNTCNLEKMNSLMSDSLEFYHDKGGLSTSKSGVIEAIKNNICGKVSRILVPGSIEVYPINNYGAVEIGYHRFQNHAEGGSVSRPGKFIIIWQKTAGQWQITRVVSLH
ncbi:nuclear transport factor 2 family protein [Foetidibacter luteolus]|uniref:nuclear transport factor 2 family protein n=1 Tax=Foetidibacter luteolus TaxID=2608880 RepID=UPI00129BCD60|nr:nuclear transport factor 2 family protein [Foetidibacter luteolus]